MVPTRDYQRCYMAGMLKREIPSLYAYIGEYGTSRGIENPAISIFFAADINDNRICDLNTLSYFPLLGQHGIGCAEYAVRPPSNVGLRTGQEDEDGQLAKNYLLKWREFSREIEAYRNMMGYYGLYTDQSYALIPAISKEKIDFQYIESTLWKKEEEIYSSVLDSFWKGYNSLFGTLPKWLKRCFAAFSYLIGRINSRNMARYYNMCKGTLRSSDYDTDLAELREATKKILLYEKDLSVFADEIERFSRDVVIIGIHYFPHHKIFDKVKFKNVSKYSFEKHIYESI